MFVLADSEQLNQVKFTVRKHCETIGAKRQPTWPELAAILAITLLIAVVLVCTFFVRNNRLADCFSLRTNWSKLTSEYHSEHLIKYKTFDCFKFSCQIAAIGGHLYDAAGFAPALYRES